MIMGRIPIKEWDMLTREQQDVLIDEYLNNVDSQTPCYNEVAQSYQDLKTIGKFRSEQEEKISQDLLRNNDRDENKF